MRRWFTIALVGALGCGQAESELQCGQGAVLADGQCVPIGRVIECGAGTFRVDGQCVPETESRCGAGTVRVGDECVPEGGGTECGPGTVRVGDECVVDPDICPSGEVLYEGECVDPASLCGDGTEFVDGECVPTSPWTGDEVGEGAENNDPSYAGTAAQVELDPDGEPLALRGVAGPAADLDGDGVPDPDLDGFEFHGVRGQTIEVGAEVFGAPDVGMILAEAPREQGAASRYWRAALPDGLGRTQRRFVLPFNGRYLLRVGTGRSVVRELGLAPSQGEPSGSEQFAWRVTLRSMESGVTQPVDEAEFVLAGSLTDVPSYRVRALPGTLLQMEMESDHPFGAWSTSERDGTAYREDPHLALVPEDGLYIQVDERVSGPPDTGFTLRASPVAVEDVGSLDRGAHGRASLDLGMGPSFVRFSVGSQTVVTAEVAAEDDVVLAILTAGFSEVVRTDAGTDQIVQLLVDPGVYLLGVLPVFPGADGSAEVTLRGEDVIDFGAVVLNSPPRAMESPDISAINSTAWFSLRTLRVGELSVEASPPVDVDVWLQVFGGRIMRRGPESFALRSANHQGVGDREDARIFAAPGTYLVGVTNRGARDVDGSRTIDLRSLLLNTHPTVRDTEPNDDVDEAQSFSEPVDERATFIEGTLALEDAGTTRDVYSFHLSEISLARVALFALDPAEPIDGARISVTRPDDSFLALTMGPGEREVSLEPGPWLISVFTPGDVPSEGYVVAVAVARSLACIPGSVRCAGEDMELCDPEGNRRVPLACNTGACEEFVDGADCGASPEAPEPNDDALSAHALGILAPGRTGVGAEIEAVTDEDWYRFTLDSGGVVTIGTRAHRERPDEQVDTYLEIYDGNVRLRQVDDDSGPGGYSLLSGLLLEAGTYFVRVSTRSDQGGFYQLFFDYVPYLCDPSASRCEDNDLYACSNGFNFSLVGTCEQGCVESGDQARCVSLGEPNDTPDQASAVVFPGEYSASVRPAGDVDYYVLEVATPVQLTVETFEAPMEAMDTRIWICAEGQPCSFEFEHLARNNDKSDGDRYSRMEAWLPAAGRYYLVVDGYIDSVGDYRMVIGETGEPNNIPGDAHRLAIPSEVHGRIEPRTDVDWYSFVVDRPLRLIATTSEEDNGTAMDPQMWLCDEDELEGCTFGAGHLARDDNGGQGLYPRLLHAFTDPGVYFLGVQGFGGSRGHYLLSLAVDPEPNDAPAMATEIRVPTSFFGTLDPGTDVDWFAFEAFAHERLQFETRPVEGGRLVDTQLWLCAAQGVDGCTFEGPNLVAADDGVFPEYSRFSYSFGASGRYYLGLHSVDDGVGDYGLVVSEPDEPNDDAQSATQLNLPTSVAARVSPVGDVDWYRFRIDGPGLVLFETEGLEGVEGADTRLSLCSSLDPGSCRYGAGDLARNDDIDVLNQYSRLVYDFEDAGVYYVVVDAAGPSEGQYRLNVTEAAEPNDQHDQASDLSVPGVQIARIDPATDADWYRFPIDEPLALVFETRRLPDADDVDTRIFLCDSSEPDSCTFIGGNLAASADGALDGHARLEYLFEEPGVHFVVVESERGDTGAYELIATEVGEPNDDAATALELSEGDLQAGRIHPAGEEDWYELVLEEPVELVIETGPRERGARLDTRLYLCEAREVRRCRFGFADLARSDDIAPDNTYSRLVHDFAEPGTFYVVVTSASDEPGHYTLGVREADEPNDDFSSALPLAVPGEDRARITPGDDVDWYVVTVTEPGSIAILTSPVQGAPRVDTRIYVCSEDQAENCAYDFLDIGRDDNSGDDGYSRLNQIFREPGRYAIVVESAGDDTGHYNLTLRDSDEPNDNPTLATFIQVPRQLGAELVPRGDVDWYVFEASPDTLLRFATGAVEGGEPVDTRMWLCRAVGVGGCTYDAGHLAADDDGGLDPGYSAVEWDFVAGGIHYLAVEAVGDDLGDYTLTVSEPGEPNDTPGEATDIVVPSVRAARIGTIEDEDWYRFTVGQGASFTFETGPVDGGIDVDTRIFLCDDQVPEACNYGLFQNLARDDNGNGVYSRIVHSFERTGAYFIVVESDGGTGDYQLDVR